jgi:hypothetical protein
MDRHIFKSVNLFAIKLGVLGLRGLTASFRSGFYGDSIEKKTLMILTRLVSQPQEQLEIKILNSVVYPSQTLVSIGLKY